MASVAVIACILFAAAIPCTTRGISRESRQGSSGNQLDKRREWLRQHFPQLINPAFAKLNLARMLPELNDPPEKLNAPFKAGELPDFRLLITNSSREKIYLPVASPYKHNRPQLLKGGEVVPYKQEAEALVQFEDTNPEYNSIRYEQVEPGHTLTEVIALNEWYEPLLPGEYKLKVRHRFIWGANGWSHHP